MTLLVADIGGTNTRIALFQPTRQILALERFANADFASFNAVLAQYRDTHALPALAGCAVAIAGPVTGGTAKLTNRDWYFDRRAIADVLALAPGAEAHLINDLAALGHSLQLLGPSQLSVIRASNTTPPQNQQAIVVGLGTGFNICVINSDSDTPVVNEAELGHASLPASVHNILHAGLGSEAAQFGTNEHLFSGDGLARLYRVFAGADEKPGPQIIAAYETGRNDAARQTVDLFARALGEAARELVFQYLPYGGIHYAGGVARGFFASSARSVFLTAFSAPGPFDTQFAMVPMRVITDDAAALVGAGTHALDQDTTPPRT